MSYDTFCYCIYIFVLRKRILSPESLQLEWRPLYDLCIRTMEKSKSEIGMYKYFASLEPAVDTLVRNCRM